MVFLFSSLLVLSAHGSELVEIPPTYNYQWLVPNELEPNKAGMYLRQSKEGVYMAVGAERGFFGFLQSNATHLLFTDISPDVANYNQMSILMLKVAMSGAQLKRFKSNTGFFRQYFLYGKSIHHNSLDQLTEAERRWIESRLDWWDRVVVNQYHSRVFAPHDWHFEGVRYWENPEQFERLQVAARKGRMRALMVNLNESSDLNLALSYVRDWGKALTVVDIDGVWVNKFWVPVPKVIKMIEQLSSKFIPRTIILFSKPDSSMIHFSYGATTYEWFKFAPQELIEDLSSRSLPRRVSFQPSDQRGHWIFDSPPEGLRGRLAYRFDPREITFGDVHSWRQRTGARISRWLVSQRPYSLSFRCVEFL